MTGKKICVQDSAESMGLAKIYRRFCTVLYFMFFCFFLHLQPPRPRIFNTLFIQYYIVICRTLGHTVGRPPGPRFEPRTFPKNEKKILDSLAHRCPGYKILFKFTFFYEIRSQMRERMIKNGSSKIACNM